MKKVMEKRKNVCENAEKSEKNEKKRKNLRKIAEMCMKAKKCV